jgi:acetyltransferase-like isoleucine patch superfamily enzyme
MFELNRIGYLTGVARRNPLELWRLLRIGLVTLKYRYLIRCAGPGSVLGVGTEIVNTANVRLGRGVLLQDHVYIRAGTEGAVRIGDRAAINSFCRIFGHGSVTIGDDTQLGPGSLITTTDHDYTRSLETRYKSVTIGREVWVGANVTILPGVEIGDGAVIGAGSVVNRSIPPRTLAVGVPARVIREIVPASPSTSPTHRETSDR